FMGLRVNDSVEFDCISGENETTCYKVSLVDRAVFSNAFEANTKALYSRFEAVISAVPLVVF
ncbi:hypothetical protein, partial [uncultured Duncaniella sp.]|uniref:hypothetical protein n=1 Tax=uncultured Duncaniella sp. TaxID=2768039 RepID=UPI002674F69E